MEKHILHAEKRTVTGKKVNVLRRQGKLPGVLYGHHVDPMPILMEQREASRVLPGLTASSLVTLIIDGKEQAVLVREKQKNFIRNTLLHVDFQVVSLTEKIRAKVNIIIEGVSPAVKDYNGMIITGLSELDVESFPQDLPERFIIDVSKLTKLGDGIYVKDIVAPNAVEILDNPDEIVVMVTTAGEEEETSETPSAEGPEVIERGKKEEAED